MDIRGAILRPMFPHHVPLLVGAIAALPKYDPLRQMSTVTLKGAFNDLDGEITSIFEANEKRGHELALLKTGYRFLSKTGWGYFGEEEYLFVFPDQISLEGGSTFDDTPVLNLPKETLAQVFDYLDPADGWGRVALALTCKKFAMVSQLSKVLKTAVNTGHGKVGLVPKEMRFCCGCGKVRPLRRGYWEEVEGILRRQWYVLPLGERDVPWQISYTNMVRSWKEGHGSGFSRFLTPSSICPFCPSCQSQQR